MREKLNSKPLTAVLLLVLFGIIGGTIAYYTSQDTFTNEFNAGKYVIKTEETFESPSNWTPGDTTPKEITVTNLGDVDAAVKVCLIPKWEDENGDELPLFDNNYEFAALIELSNNYDLYWLNDCDNNFEDNYCFYYYTNLAPGETTKPLLDSITYNPYFEFNQSTDCTTDPTTHKKTCTTELGDYSGGKFTLTANIETVQYSEYQNIWSDAQVQTQNSCEPLMLRNKDLYHNMMMKIESNNYNVLGKRELSHHQIYSLEFKDNKNIPANAIESWDVSALHDGSVMAWYTNDDNDYSYDLFVGADGGVVANPDSSYAFSELVNLRKIDVTNLDTSRVKNMNHMFYEVGEESGDTIYIGLENLDTSNVESMNYMFMDTGYSSSTLDFSNWDLSSLQSACYMFLHSNISQTGIDVNDLQCTT